MLDYKTFEGRIFRVSPDEARASACAQRVDFSTAPSDADRSPNDECIRIYILHAAVFLE